MPQLQELQGQPGAEVVQAYESLRFIDSQAEVMRDALGAVSATVNDLGAGRETASVFDEMLGRLEVGIGGEDVNSAKFHDTVFGHTGETDGSISIIVGDGIIEKRAQHIMQAGVDEENALIMALFWITAHEAGHALQAAHERVQMHDAESALSVRSLSQIVVGAEENRFVAGADATIVEHERFAEGIAQETMRRELSSLGFEPEQIEDILGYYSGGFIDGIQAARDQVNSGAADTIQDAMSRGDVDTAGTYKHSAVYLGYANPLSAPQLWNRLSYTT